MTRRRWTDAELQILRDRYANTRTADLADELGRSCGKVHQKAHTLGLRKDKALVAEMARIAMADPSHPGRRSQFRPGTVPANKGMRRPGYAPGNMGTTQFKPGAMPSTWLPVGTYRVNSDGYLDLKVSEEPGPRHKRWHTVHRLVWIAANGPVPKGHVVVFREGRHTTELDKITLDAVECITRRQLMDRNSVHTVYPPALRSLAQLRGALTRQINKRSREQKP